VPFVALFVGLFGFILWRQSQPSSPNLSTLPPGAVAGAWTPVTRLQLVSSPGVYRFEVALPSTSTPLSQADFMESLGVIQADLVGVATVDFLSISYPGSPPLFVSSSGTVAPSDWPAAIDVTPWIQRWQVTAIQPIGAVLADDDIAETFRAAWIKAATT
jgi:hypothetical protein